MEGISYIELTLYLSILVLVAGNAVIWYLTRRDLSAILNWITTLPDVFERMQKNKSAAWVIPGKIGRLMSMNGVNMSDGTSRSTSRNLESTGANTHTDDETDSIIMYRPLARNDK